MFQERQSREQAYLERLQKLADQARQRRSSAPPNGTCGLGGRRGPDAGYGATPLMLGVLAAGGNNAGALQTYRDLRHYLRREINAEPDLKTRALFQQLRSEARSQF